MSRLRLTIAYDGQPFAGWQSQPGVPTVQDTIESAIATVTGRKLPKCRIHGSGRTDAGVHATGQVAHFDAPEGTSLGAGAWLRALNSHLPPTVRIMACERAEDDFHARFGAVRKTYEYRIYHGDVLPPFEAGRAWHVFGRLNTELLEEGLVGIIGRHDFGAFAANRGDASDQSSRQRTILGAQLAIDGRILTLRYTGTGFLYKMVRLLTGGLLHCARRCDSIEWFTELLNHPERHPKCRHCAPAYGLCLVCVEYA